MLYVLECFVTFKREIKNSGKDPEEKKIIFSFISGLIKSRQYPFCIKIELMFMCVHTLYSPIGIDCDVPTMVEKVTDLSNWII